MRRGMPVGEATRREILRKQMELLAEASFSTSESRLAEFSNSMVRVNRELRKPFSTIFLIIVLLDFTISFFVLIKNFSRSRGR